MSRGATTRRPNCTISTAPMPCIRTRHLAARFLVGRSHWLSPCVRSLRLAARLLVVPIALALLRLCHASGRAVLPLEFLVDRSHWLSPCVWSPRLATRLLVVRIAPALLRLCRASGRALSTLDFSSVGRTGSHRVPGHSVVRRDYPSRCRNRYTSPTPRVWVLRHVARLVAWLIVDYFAYAARLGASAHRTAHHAARHTARRRLLRLCHAFGCLGTSRGSSRGSSSTTSTMPRARVPRHVARLVMLFIVNFDYAACPGASARRAARRAACRRLLRSRRLVVDYFDYATCPGASARCAARHAACRAARCRLLRLRHASGCLGTSRGSSHGSSSTTSTMPRVRVPRHIALVTPFIVNFDYVAGLGASACRAACRAVHHQLRLHRTSGGLGTSPGSSRRSSSTTSPRVGLSSTTSTTPRVQVPRHVARLVTRLVALLVVDYFDYAARPGASARRAAHRVTRRRLLRLRRASGCLGTLRGSSRGLSSTTPCAATSSCGHTGSTSATQYVVTTCLATTLALLRVRHALP
jgi:hypothetical protein